jgi:hypothetical protein
MKTLSKSWALLLTTALVISSLLFIQSVSAQSIPAVTDFTLQYVDNSYDTPPTTSSTQDPYNGQITTTTHPGTHIENKTVIATIKNPSGATYYNFRWKGHYDTTWQYSPFSPDSEIPYFVADGYSVPFKASTSTYSKFWLSFLPQQISADGSIDVQVQALYGNFRAEPYVHVGWVGAPTYDFYFEGETSYWSSTQTISYSQASIAPSPMVQEFPATAILPLFIVIPLIAAIFIRKYAAKTASPYYKKR